MTLPYGVSTPKSTPMPPFFGGLSVFVGYSVGRSGLPAASSQPSSTMPSIT